MMKSSFLYTERLTLFDGYRTGYQETIKKISILSIYICVHCNKIAPKHLFKNLSWCNPPIPLTTLVVLLCTCSSFSYDLLMHRCPIFQSYLFSPRDPLMKLVNSHKNCHSIYQHVYLVPSVSSPLQRLIKKQP